MPKTTMAFYKGTVIEAPITQHDEFMDTCIKGANTVIIGMLRKGYTLDDVKESVKEQLDVMEEGLCVAQKKLKDEGKFIPYEKMTTKKYRAYLAEVCFHTMTGDQFISKWFLNIATLLKLKVIENDDKNGWLTSTYR